ncbi:MAG: hypothetical protein LBR54_02750 [Oscillospiraceae bacterium]|jgi:hypothetical protein|nr:hypothetical protein [Oscillospiraceae bacterium]
MAKVTIAGNSYVVTSEISMADLETVKKYRPTALVLIDEETKETYFKIGVGTSSISEFGISFGGISNGEEKLSSATLPIPPDTEDAKEYVLDKAGLALANLNKIEERISGTLQEIRSERDAISANISVSV